MSGPRTSRSDLRPWHELIEHYTPDGWLGRILLAAAAGGFGGTALLGTVWVVAVALPVWPLLALAALAAGLGGVGLALVALWPVYLSLIGNVESASAYSEGGATRLAVRADTANSGAATDPDDAVATLKRRYAAGEITEEEFERRLDDLLDVDAVLDSRDQSTERATRPRETERN